MWFGSIGLLVAEAVKAVVAAEVISCFTRERCESLGAKEFSCSLLFRVGYYSGVVVLRLVDATVIVSAERADDGEVRQGCEWSEVEV